MSNRFSRLALTVGAAAVLIAAPLQFTPYTNSRLTLVLIYAIAVLGLNLLTGYTGQISLAQSAFFAIGAYTAALLVADDNVPHLLTIVPAAALGFAGGFLLGLPALRVRGLYLALVTLAFAVVTPQAIKAAGGLTRGAAGLTFPQLTAPAWTGLANDQFSYYGCLAIAGVAFLVGGRLVQGRTGRALVAVRDDEIAAAAHGVAVARVKTTAFAMSAAFASTAGALYAITLGFVAPEAFTLQLSFLLAIAGFVGGLRSVMGAVLGAAFIVFVPQYAGEVDPRLTNLIFGLALLGCLYLLPNGVWGLIGRLRLRHRAALDFHPLATAVASNPGASDAPPRRR